MADGTRDLTRLDIIIVVLGEMLEDCLDVIESIPHQHYDRQNVREKSEQRRNYFQTTNHDTDTTQDPTNLEVTI